MTQPQTLFGIAITRRTLVNLTTLLVMTAITAIAMIVHAQAMFQVVALTIVATAASIMAVVFLVVLSGKGRV